VKTNLVETVSPTLKKLSISLYNGKISWRCFSLLAAFSQHKLFFEGDSDKIIKGVLGVDQHFGLVFWESK